MDEVRKCFREAAQLAALAAPYRHARLSAVKHLEQGSKTIDGISANATPEELRAEIAKRVRQSTKGTSILKRCRHQRMWKGLSQTKKINKRGRAKALPPPEPAAST